MSLLERVFYFHQQILEERFPNSRTIADHFEVSVATSRRDIAYLRDTADPIMKEVCRTAKAARYAMLGSALIRGKG